MRKHGLHLEHNINHFIKPEEAREHLWENLTKGHSAIPGSGMPSDWSILTDFVNTRALLTQMRYTIWRQSETFQRVTQFSNLL